MKLHYSIFVVLVGMLAAETDCLAFDWVALGDECSDVIIPGMDKFVTDATAWEALQKRAQTEVDVLTNKTCPAYLQSANGAQGMESTQKLTLEEYISQQAGTFSDVGDSTGKARTGDTFLASNLNRIAAIHAPAGFDFPGSPCGQTITSGRKHFQNVINTLQSKTTEYGKVCPKLAAKIAEEGPDPAKTIAHQGAGGVPKGVSAIGASTITGNPDFDRLPDQSSRQNAAASPQTRNNYHGPAAGADSALAASVGERAPASMEGTEVKKGRTGAAGLPEGRRGKGLAAVTTYPGSHDAEDSGISLDPSKEDESEAAAGFGEKLAPGGTALPATPDIGGNAVPAGSVSRSANSEPVPNQNDDKDRFLRETGISQSALTDGTSSETTLFTQVSRRYRALSAHWH
ncbi:MAG: hypothetical protein ACXWSC_11920 [Bdellovibrionota bacterium]